MRRPITSKHASLFVVGPSGLIDVGKCDGWETSDENEVITYKPTDGTTLHEHEGENYSGSLSAATTTSPSPPSSGTRCTRRFRTKPGSSCF